MINTGASPEQVPGHTPQASFDDDLATSLENPSLVRRTSLSTFSVADWRSEEVQRELSHGLLSANVSMIIGSSGTSSSGTPKLMSAARQIGAPSMERLSLTETIILIDSDTEAAEEAATVIESLEYKVIRCTTCTAAMDHLRAQSAFVVLVDGERLSLFSLVPELLMPRSQHRRLLRFRVRSSHSIVHNFYHRSSQQQGFVECSFVHRCGWLRLPDHTAQRAGYGASNHSRIS